DRSVGLPVCRPRVPSSVHQSLRVCPGKQLRGRPLNPPLRTPVMYGKLHAAALRLRWNLRELFLPGSSHPECARTATTPDTVRPVHGAATVVGVVKDRDFS